MGKKSIATFRHGGGASCHNAFKQKTKTKQNEIHEKKLAQNNFSFPFENIKNHNKRIAQSVHIQKSKFARHPNQRYTYIYVVQETRPVFVCHAAVIICVSYSCNCFKKKWIKENMQSLVIQIDDYSFQWLHSWGGGAKLTKKLMKFSSNLTILSNK